MTARLAPSPWTRWFAAVATPAIDAAIGDLYARLDEEVRRRGPTCWTSGKCCNFDAYGHRLYVTGLEIAWVVVRVGSSERRVQDSGEGGGTPTEKVAARATALPLFNSELQTPNAELPACRFQVDKLCSIHAVRPMGCRVYFCQEGQQEWQRALYERYLGELRDLHDTLALPYEYMEWRHGLDEAMAAR